MAAGYFEGHGRTLKPLKKHTMGTRRFDLHSLAKKTLGTGDMRGAVVLPEGEDLNEWLAVHTVDFFNEINLLFGTIVPFCTPESCPSMTAGPKFEYLWADNNLIKKPIRVSAREYVDYLLTWIEGFINNESIFPTSVDHPFPETFVETVKTIFKRMFRVYAHIYYHHWDRLVDIKAEAHLNTCFKHFIFFVYEFDLIPERDLAPLAELIREMRGAAHSDASRESAAAVAAVAAGMRAAATGSSE